VVRADSNSRVLYEFDVFQLNPLERRLTKNGIYLSVQPKIFDILSLLLERRGRSPCCGAARHSDSGTRFWRELTVSFITDKRRQEDDAKQEQERLDQRLASVRRRLDQA
jgi:DNA-binding response OmpR family regulator